jgi:hypothetical protein
MSALVESLNIIVVEMRSKKPDRKRIDEILDYLGKQKWVPNLIISIVGSIIAASVMSA